MSADQLLDQQILTAIRNAYDGVDADATFSEVVDAIHDAVMSVVDPRVEMYRHVAEAFQGSAHFTDDANRMETTSRFRSPSQWRTKEARHLDR